MVVATSVVAIIINSNISMNSIEPTTQNDPEPKLAQTNVIVASTVTSVILLIIAIAVVAIITCVAAKRFEHSQLVLQVNGDSMDILDGAKLQSINTHRYTIGNVNSGFNTKSLI